MSTKKSGPKLVDSKPTTQGQELQERDARNRAGAALFISLVRAAQHIAERQGDARRHQPTIILGGLLAQAVAEAQEGDGPQALFLVLASDDISEMENADETDWAINRLLALAVKVYSADNEHWKKIEEGTRARAVSMRPIFADRRGL